MFSASLRAVRFASTTSWILLLGLFLLCAGVYWPALHGPLILDDLSNVVPARLDRFTWRSLYDAATSNDSGILGRALPVATFSLNWALSPDHPVMTMKTTNLLLHLLNALLLWELLRRLVRASDERSGTPAAVRSSTVVFLAVTLWMLHPLHVSTVMYVVQRMALMSTTFTLLALIAYVRLRTSTVPSHADTVRWGLATLLFTLLACLSKENGALIPIHVIALEATVLRSTPAHPRPWSAKACLLAAFSGVCVLLIALATRIPAFTDVYRTRDFGLAERLMAQTRIVTEYLYWIVVPDTTRYTFFHDDVVAPDRIDTSVVVATLLLAGLLALAVRLRKTLPLTAFGLLLFLGSQLLESTAIPLELAFEHRNYLGSAGVILAMIGLLQYLLVQRTRSTVLFSAALVAIGLLAVLTLHHARTWGDGVRLSLHAVIDAPRSERAWIELASTLYVREGRDRAIAALDMASVHLPDNPYLELHRLRVAWQAGPVDLRQRDRTLRTLSAHPVNAQTAKLLRLLFDEYREHSGPSPTVAELVQVYDAAIPGNHLQLTDKAVVHLLFQYHRLLLEGERYADAVNVVTRLGTLMPNDGEIAVRTAETHVLAGYIGRAAVDLERARRHPDASRARFSKRLDRIADRIASIEQ